MEQEYQNRVEDYLNGNLNEIEQEQFEKELKDNVDLNKIYHEYTLTMEIIDQQAENELRSKFSDWQLESMQNKMKSRSIYVYVGIAASILLLVCTYLIFFQQNPSLTNEQLALEYYSLPKEPGMEMGNAKELWSEGIVAYEQQNFAIAIEAWSAIKDPSSEVNYYLAHSYFNTKDYNSAISLFKTLSNGTSVYSYPSDWYLLLSYLSAGDQENFNGLLNKILQNQDHPYYPDAKQLQVEASGTFRH